MSVESNIAVDRGIWFLFETTAETQARLAWRRGKGRSRAASRRRSRRARSMTFTGTYRVVPGEYLPYETHTIA